MDADEREIRQVVATWMTATQAGDIETVLTLMADDVVFLIAGRPPMIGKAAFIWTKLTVVVTPPGGASPMTRAGYTLSIFSKQNGRWVLARDANMLAAVDPGERSRG